MAICITCGDGKEYKNLSVHMNKKHGGSTKDISEQPAANGAVNKASDTNMDTTAPDFVSRDEFNKMLKLMEQMVAEQKKDKAPAAESLQQAQEMSMGPKPGKAPIDPKWRKIVDSILGPEFGLDVVYPSKGSGFLFKIIVPLDRSNADKSHLSFYKTDVRTKAINMGEAEGGITAHCKKVKENLAKSNQNKI